MDYKLKKEEKDHFLIHHPDGSEFKVSKKGIGGHVVKKIKSLQMYDGGLVSEENSSSMPEEDSIDVNPPQEQQPQAPVNPNSGYKDFFNQRVEFYKNDLGPNVPADSYISAALKDTEQKKNADMYSQAQAATQQQKSQELQNKVASFFGEGVQTSVPGQQQRQPADLQMQQEQAPDPYAGMEKAYNNIYGAQSQAWNQQEKAVQEQLKADSARNLAYQQKTNQYLEEHDKMANDIANAKVDPNRFWNQSSTGTKLAAGLAVILGGIGQGLQGSQQNAGLNAINKIIDDDIASQKADLGKKENLLSMNLKKLGSMEAAENATRLQQNAALQGKIQMYSARSNSAQAQGQLQLIREQLQLKKQELAQKQAVMAGLASGNVSNEMAQMLPEDQRERYIPGEGFALSKKGAEDLRTLKADHDTSVGAIDQLIQMRQKYGTESLPTAAKAQAKAIAGILQGRLRTFLVGPGAVSESERELINSVVNKDPLSLASLDSTTLSSLQTLKNAVGQGYGNALTAQGVRKQSKTFEPLR